MGQVSVFKIDLTRIDGDGEFACPSCGIVISPDDESEDTYKIIGIKTKTDGSLESLRVLCTKCGSKIHLEGFQVLDELENPEESDGS